MNKIAFHNFLVCSFSLLAIFFFIACEDEQLEDDNFTYKSTTPVFSLSVKNDNNQWILPQGYNGCTKGIITEIEANTDLENNTYSYALYINTDGYTDTVCNTYDASEYSIYISVQSSMTLNHLLNTVMQCDFREFSLSGQSYRHFMLTDNDSLPLAVYYENEYGGGNHIQPTVNSIEDFLPLEIWHDQIDSGKTRYCSIDTYNISIETDNGAIIVDPFTSQTITINNELFKFDLYYHYSGASNDDCYDCCPYAIAFSVIHDSIILR